MLKDVCNSRDERGSSFKDEVNLRDNMSLKLLGSQRFQEWDEMSDVGVIINVLVVQDSLIESLKQQLEDLLVFFSCSDLAQEVVLHQCGIGEDHFFEFRSFIPKLSCYYLIHSLGLFQV